MELVKALDQLTGGRGPGYLVKIILLFLLLIAIGICAEKIFNITIQKLKQQLQSTIPKSFFQLITRKNTLTPALPWIKSCSKPAQQPLPPSPRLVKLNENLRDRNLNGAGYYLRFVISGLSRCGLLCPHKGQCCICSGFSKPLFSRRTSSCKSSSVDPSAVTSP